MPRSRYRLLNRNEGRTGEIDLGANTRLQVMSPYGKQPGVGMLEEPVAVSGNSSSSLTITAKSTDNLLGEETSIYALQRKRQGPGYVFEPLYAELDRRTKILESSGDAASCAQLPAGWCVALPKDVAVLPMVAVTVNASEVLVARGSRLSGALAISGQPRPADALPDACRSQAPERAGRACRLSLGLLGGESITYTRK